MGGKQEKWQHCILGRQKNSKPFIFTTLFVLQDNAFLAANSTGKVSNAELARMLTDSNGGGACGPDPYMSKYIPTEKCNNGDHEYDAVLEFWEDEKFKPTRV